MVFCNVFDCWFEVLEKGFGVYGGFYVFFEGELDFGVNGYFLLVFDFVVVMYSYGLRSINVSMWD